MLSRVVLDIFVRGSISSPWQDFILQLYKLSCSMAQKPGQSLNQSRGFHNRVARRIARHCMPSLVEGVWVYPPLADAFKAPGIASLETYIQERQARLVDKIAMRPILELSQESAPSSNPRRKFRWDQQFA